MGGAAGAKPPLLRAMEDRLEKEMGILSASGPVDPKERMRVYREVLHMFGEGFRNYGPMLEQMLDEFDHALNDEKRSAQNAIRQATDLQIRKDADYAEMEKMEREKEELAADYDKKISALQARLEELQSTREDASGVSESLVGELDSLKRERVEDKEKILALIRAVRESDRRLRVAQDRIHSMGLELEKMEDTKDLLRKSQVRLGEMKDMYRETVPLSKHEATVKEMEAKLEEIRESEMKFRRFFAQRGCQVERFARTIGELNADRERLKKGKKKEGERALTPRPDWREVHDLVSNLDIFDTNREGDADGDAIKSTANCVNLLVFAYLKQKERNAELEERVSFLNDELLRISSTQAVVAQHTQPIVGDTKGSSGLYLGRGMNSLVWPCLRTVGHVPKRIFLRAEVVETLLFFFEGVRKLKGMELTSLHDRLAAFFAQQYGKQRYVHAYGTIEACYGLRYVDPPCQLFISVLEGSLPTRIVFDVLAHVESVKNEIVGLAATLKKKKVRKGNVMEVVGPLLAMKSRDSLDRLKVLLGKTTTIDSEEVTRPVHPFMEELLRQGATESMAFYHAVLASVFSLAVGLPSCGSEERVLSGEEADISSMGITSENVQKAIRELEPMTPASVLVELGRFPDDPTAAQSEDPLPPSEQRQKLIAMTVILERLCMLPIMKRSAQPTPSQLSSAAPSMPQTPMNVPPV